MTTNLSFSDKKFYLICYDIVENRRRNRVMKTMVGYGFRVQKSVFECYLTQEQLDRLKKRVSRQIDEKTDSVRIYPLTPEEVKNVQVIGIGNISESAALLVV